LARFRLAQFLLTASVNVGRGVSGLYDQDFIHNEKKLINPLDLQIKTLHWEEMVVVWNI
jgi:hypothetical protein